MVYLSCHLSRAEASIEEVKRPRGRAAGQVRTAAADPIARPKVYQEIARRLEAQILDDRLQPGDALPSERHLMERHGVGRPAVREALLSLQKAGLIAIQNGERARVVQPSASALVGELGSAARYLLSREGGVRQFQQARQMFEIALVRHAAVNATAHDVDRLAAALAANRTALSVKETFAATDVAFHFVLAEIPRNPIFIALHVALAEWLTEQRLSTLRWRGAARKALKSHQAIFEAVASRDPDAAEAAMRNHLIEVEKAYWRARGVADSR